MPWPTATKMLTKDSDGLLATWHGRVWLNPPYGPETGWWLAKLARHGRGTALIFARTETDAWFRFVWPVASGILFLKGRLTFCRECGTPGDKNAGGPSALIAYGPDNAKILAACKLPGKYLSLQTQVANPLPVSPA